MIVRDSFKCDFIRMGLYRCSWYDDADTKEHVAFTTKPLYAPFIYQYDKTGSVRIQRPAR